MRRHSPEWVLVGGMAFSAFLVLWFGRDLSFTEDEVMILSRVGSFSPGDLFEPYAGHLVAVPLLAYWLTGVTFGVGSYVPFQVLTLLSIFLLAWILFLWGKRRVTPWVALAAAFLILIFPQDIVHYLNGNGFVIVFALACGLGSLYAFQRRDGIGDLAAFALLVTGMLTYTVAVPFALGLMALAVSSRRWPSLWVGALPLVAYLIWRAASTSSGIRTPVDQPDLANLLLLPAWAFQALGGYLVALSGGGFGFLDIPLTAAPSGYFIATSFAIVFLLAGAYAMTRGRDATDLIVIGLITIALLASQTLIWGTRDEPRPGPVQPRYLYPGALFVLLLGLEFVRGIRWDRRSVVAVWVVTVLALTGSLGFLANADLRETSARQVKAEILAITLLDSTGAPPPVRAQPRQRTQAEFDPVDGGRFGYLGLTEAELGGEEPAIRNEVDRFLAKSFGISLGPVPPGLRPTSCRLAATGFVTGATQVPLPRNGAILVSNAPLEPAIGRYGDRAMIEVGKLAPGVPGFLRLRRDEGSLPWFISVAQGQGGTLADLTICRIAGQGSGR